MFHQKGRARRRTKSAHSLAFDFVKRPDKTETKNRKLFYEIKVFWFAVLLLKKFRLHGKLFFRLLCAELSLRRKKGRNSGSSAKIPSINFRLNSSLDRLLILIIELQISIKNCYFYVALERKRAREREGDGVEGADENR